MSDYTAKRIRFQNGERYSVLMAPNGVPVHEATLYLNRYRKSGRAANTIHFVCSTLALTYRELARAGIDLLPLLRTGHFLSAGDINRLADIAQYRVADLSYEAPETSRAKVIDIKRVRARRKMASVKVQAVNPSTQASRLRYISDYLDFLVAYFKATLPEPQRHTLEHESTSVLKALRAQIPRTSRSNKLDAREGLSREDQDRLLAVISPDSPQNPWQRGFVRQRNWLMIMLLLATGMRRGELLGLQIGDLNPRLPKFRIVRRADAREDPRRIQPNTKTGDRELELRPSIMREVWDYINHHRQKIKVARKYSQLFVADDGKPLSLRSVDKMFAQIREACPGLPIKLSSHVLRHTWNDRFSEQAEQMNLSDAVEEKARNEQQGWTDNSKTAATYTRRHASRKGRELSLKIQEKLDAPSR